MKIAIEGCAHGELEKIYDSISAIEKNDNIKIDLLICCGDFQSTRNISDLRCMAVPVKYQSICTFYKYYSGEKTAPILTIFIGGNHEASNYLQELPYGGWVAPKIYYLGYAGIINVAGIRIGGISGIYKGHDYLKGHYEKAPYTEETKRSVYHIRNLEVFRLKQIQQSIDIFLSHDWPRGIYKYGNIDQLLKIKPFFREEINSNVLGSKPCEDLLNYLKPTYWFSAHLHCKFAALVKHQDQQKKKTKFLALDKCLPKRKFLQIIDFPNDREEIKLEYDLEWLSIVYLTNHLLSVKKVNHYMPGPNGTERWEFSPSKAEMDLVANRLDYNLDIPLNFSQTASPYVNSQNNIFTQAIAQTNPQTTSFCEKLGIDDPIAFLIKNDNSFNHNISETSTCSLPSFLTPEKSGNLSHASFINDSDMDHENSFDVESPVNINSNSVPNSFTVKRESLTLPEPVHSQNDYNQLEACQDKGNSEESPVNINSNFEPNSFTVKRVSLTLPEPVQSQNDYNQLEACQDKGNSEKSPVKSINNSINEEEEANISATTENNSPERQTSLTTAYQKKELETKMKKFKRRNQSIYGSTEDED